MKAFILILALSLFSCNIDDYGFVNITQIKKLASETAEEAYFEGQKDAMSGDIRIKQTQDSCWIWTKSPWEGGKKPTFNPSIICQ